MDAQLHQSMGVSIILEGQPPTHLNWPSWFFPLFRGLSRMIGRANVSSTEDVRAKLWGGRFVEIQVSCSAEGHSAVRDGRYPVSKYSRTSLYIAGHFPHLDTWRKKATFPSYSFNKVCLIFYLICWGCCSGTENNVKKTASWCEIVSGSWAKFLAKPCTSWGIFQPKLLDCPTCWCQFLPLQTHDPTKTDKPKIIAKL